MALDGQTFRTRTVTAIVFVVIMAFGLLWSRWSFFLLFSVVHFGCWLEYQTLVGKINGEYSKISSYHKYGVMAAGWCLLLYFTNSELQLADIDLSLAGLWLGVLFLFLLPLFMVLPIKRFFLNNIGYSLFGLVYISLSLSLLIHLRNYWIEEEYRLSLSVPLLIIFTLWINDTMAYVTGSLIGKTPLSSISPKKTWEGTIGGVILSVIVLCIIAYSTGRLPVLHTAILSFIAAVAGTIGDLFQSKLKRMAGVKDSGKLMPGHGGFLDRFDSLLFAAIACWLYAVLVL